MEVMLSDYLLAIRLRYWIYWVGFMRQILTALIMMSFLAANAHAAQLTNIQGQVFVNRGDGFKQVTGPTQVNPGDRVLAGANGKAQVFYDGSCFNNVGAGQAIIIPQGQPCAPAAEQTATTGGIGTTTLVVGGLVVAVGAGVAIAASSRSSKKPVSP